MRQIRLTRRQLLLAAAGTAAAAIGPWSSTSGEVQAELEHGLPHFFFEDWEYQSCDALCSAILPDVPSPGAGEARAVDYIDLFLAAFELPTEVADGPAIFLHGRFSGRNPYENPAVGGPSSHYPSDDFQNQPAGRRHFLGLTAVQELGWRARLYGGTVLESNANLPDGFRSNLRSGLNPPPTGYRQQYRRGLQALTEMANRFFGRPIAELEQVMLYSLLAASASPLVDWLPLPVTMAAPPEAKELLPVLVRHTLEGSFAIDAYGANRDLIMWRQIGWEGDTAPLGNSLYDSAMIDAEMGHDQGHNAGFGMPGIYQPKGGYRQYRAVSTAGIEPTETHLTEADLEPLIAGLRRTGILRGGRSGGRQL